MDVVVKDPPIEQTPLVHVKVGDTFIFEGRVCIKTDLEEGVKSLIVELSTGYSKWVDFPVRVRPLKQITSAKFKYS